MRIRVTRADIKNGIPKDSLSCPIALAIRRACPRSTQVSVYENVIIHQCGVRLPPIELPEEALAFIMLFDDQKPVRPFSFEVDLP